VRGAPSARNRRRVVRREDHPASPATAMIDRLIHHSEILSLKGDSYRLRGKDLDARIAAKTAEIT
jgi:hypothetical protein